MPKPSKLSISVLSVAAIAMVLLAASAGAAKKTVTKVPLKTTVHAVLTSQGVPTGIYEGKVTSSFPACARGATVTLSAPALPGDISGNTEYSANGPAKSDGSWRLVLGEAGSPLTVTVQALGLFHRVSAKKTVQCKKLKETIPLPTS